MKQFYRECVCGFLQSEFPALVSYNRFVEFERDALVPLSVYLQARGRKCTGISFTDSTKLAVCENLRIPQHRQFTGSARQNDIGLVFRLQLHIIISDCGEPLSWQVTPKNCDDRRPVPKLAKRLFGKLFDDLGYLSEPLKILLREQNLELVTKLKKNMKNKFLNLSGKLLLRKRAIIESVFDQLKNISQIEHAQHRSFWNLPVNLGPGLIAYSWREKKPSLNYDVKELFLLC